MDNTQNTDQQQNENTQNNGPVEVLRHGRLKATIWQNEGEKGPYWSTDFAKTITGQDGNPRDVRSFSQTEILRINELGREAYSMINELKRQHKLEQSQDQSQSQERSTFRQSRRHSNGRDNSQSQAF